MLKIRFDPTGRIMDDRVIVEPPYELVANFIVRDIQASPTGARNCVRMLRAVIDGTGPPIEQETGNMWTMDADPTWTTLTNDYGHPTLSVRVPTPWLLDAIERWHAYLIERGVPSDQ